MDPSAALTGTQWAHRVCGLPSPQPWIAEDPVSQSPSPDSLGGGTVTCGAEGEQGASACLVLTGNSLSSQESLL